MKEQIREEYEPDTKVGDAWDFIQVRVRIKTKLCETLNSLRRFLSLTFAWNIMLNVVLFYFSSNVVALMGPGTIHTVTIGTV